MAVSFVGVGTVVLSGAQFMQPTLPTGLADGDVLLMVATNSNLIGNTSTIALAVSPGWDVIFDGVNTDPTIGGRNHLLIAVKRVDVVSLEPAPWVRQGQSGNVAGSARVYAFRGVDNVAPVGAQAASSNAAIQDLGPITGVTVPANDAVVIIGHRANDWTSVAPLSGDGLTWVEASDDTSTLADDHGIVVDYALNNTGSPVAVTAKTFTVTGGQAGTGLGVSLTLKSGSPITPDFKSWEANRIRETTTTTGTGNITLLGAVAKYADITSDFMLGDVFPYLIKDSATGAWEHGVGRRIGVSTMERVAVIASSNSNARVNFAAGTKQILIPDTASDEFAANLSRYGDASDGDVTISGAVSMLKPVNYRIGTFTAGAALVSNGFDVNGHVIDLTNAPAGAISYDGTVGGTAVANVAGGAGAALSSMQYGGSPAGGAGAAGTTTGNTGGGAGGSAPSGIMNGGAAGTGGAGGFSGVTAGGAGGAGTTFGAAPLIIRNFAAASFLRGVSIVLGGQGGGGGGTGRGSDSILSGGGGGGGAGGGVLVVRAMVLVRGASTAAGAIRARGGSGGGGGAATAGGTLGRGGGGGGAGGGGGWIVASIGALAGSTATGLFDVSGGNGGAGGTGVNFSTGTASGGSGGNGGRGGRVDLQLRGIPSVLLAASSPATGTPGAASGNTAGTGGAGSTWRMDL